MPHSIVISNSVYFLLLYRRIDTHQNIEHQKWNLEKSWILSWAYIWKVCPIPYLLNLYFFLSYRGIDTHQNMELQKWNLEKSWILSWASIWKVCLIPYLLNISISLVNTCFLWIIMHGCFFSSLKITLACYTYIVWVFRYLVNCIMEKFHTWNLLFHIGWHEIID